MSDPGVDPVVAPQHRAGGGAGSAAVRSLALPAVLFVVAVVALLTGPRGGSGSYGLVSALPWPYVVAVLAMVVVFVVGLLRTAAPAVALYAQVVLLAVALALAPALLESYARFATAYTHAGFVDYIQRTGEVLDGYDARFSWPAFFGTGALFAEATGLQPDQLLRWAPLLVDLLYLLAFAAIAARFLPDPRRRAFALLLFVLFNWVGQDYFAPQGFNFFLFLVLVAVLATVYPLTRPDAGLGRLLSRLLLRRDTGERGGAHRGELPARVRGGLLAAALVVFAASVVSHQLTPVFAMLAVTVLVLLRVVRSWTLPVVFAVLFLSYFIWGATDYWSGHLGELLGGVGKLSDAVQQNVSSRVTPSVTYTSGRRVVVYARVGMALLLLALAVVGLLRNRDRRLVVPAALAVTPVVVLALQSYGGEAILRIELFALPFFCLLAAHSLSLAAPVPGRWTARPVARLTSLVLVCALACGVTGLFALARYGNESFEEMRAVDVATVDRLYAEVPSGAVLFSFNDQLPWKDRRIGDVQYGQLDPRTLLTEDPDRIFAVMRSAPGPTYLVVAESEWAELRQLDGVPADAIARAKALLGSTPYVHLVSGDADSGVYLVDGNTP